MKKTNNLILNFKKFNKLNLFFKETSKFSLVGLLNTLINIAIYNILLFLKFNYITANIIGYIAGMFNSYILNKKWVFKNNCHNNFIIFKFIIVNLISLLINNLTLYLFVSYFFINKNISQIFAIILGFIINFLASKFWTFI